jgi:hypothetical protein
MNTVLLCGLDSVSSRYCLRVCCCQYENEPSASIKDGECYDMLSKFQLLKKDSFPWI